MTFYPSEVVLLSAARASPQRAAARHLQLDQPQRLDQQPIGESDVLFELTLATVDGEGGVIGVDSVDVAPWAGRVYGLSGIVALEDPVSAVGWQVDAATRAALKSAGAFNVGAGDAGVPVMIWPLAALLAAGTGGRVQTTFTRPPHCGPWPRF